MLKIPSELLDMTINKKCKIEIFTTMNQIAVNLGKYPTSVIKVVSGQEPGRYTIFMTKWFSGSDFSDSRPEIPNNCKYGFFGFLMNSNKNTNNS
jgi:hypothetical protein